MTRTRRRAFVPVALLALALLPLALLFLMAAPPAPAAAQAARVSDLEFPPLPAVEIPRPERRVLSNGMVVLLLEDHELPLVEVAAYIQTGGFREPTDKVGLARLTGSVMRSGGTERMGADELDRYLDSLAARVEVMIFEDTGMASMEALAADFPAVLGVLADVLRRPAFAADRLEAAKVQERSQVARQNDSPQSILYREFDKVVYGPDSPYARRPTYATLDRIGRDDLVAWHRAYFRPERIVLGVTGDFRTSEALRLLEQAFSDWPRSGDGKDPEVPEGNGPTPGVYYARKDDVNQSNILMGTLGIRRDHPDYYAVEVMNEVLSGGFGTRLVTNIRTKKGLAYAVYGQVGSDYDRRGTTQAFLSTKTSTTGAGLDALLAELRGMVTSPPTEEEVAKAKQTLLESFIFRYDTPRKVLRQQLQLEHVGYPADWLARYRRGIEAVTVEQVRKAAADHLKPERFAIVVVGPREGTDRPLSDFGRVTTLDIDIAEEAKAASAR